MYIRWSGGVERKWITTGKYGSSSSAGSKVGAESEGTNWFVVNRPPFSVLSQPLSPHPSASSPAMIRNHNLMLHCHTVSTSILQRELNDPFVQPRLRCYPTYPSGEWGLWGLITSTPPSSSCDMLIRPVLWTYFWRWDSAALMPPPLRAWPESTLMTSLMLHHRVNMSASMTVLRDGNC